jgi:CheY-like chemotaxis protein
MFNILVVDDEPFNRELVIFALEEIKSQYDISIFEAENGQQALSQLKKNEIDIVFMDIMMPIMNGIEAVENMKKDPCLKDVIVIALTALDDRETRKKLFNMAINDFITKPFDALELIVKTRAYLSLKSMIKNSAPAVSKEIVSEENSYEPIVIIKNDKDIMGFWKCIRNHESIFEHKLDINTFMSLLYAFYMKYKIGFKIFISKYDNEIHFSITNKTLASYVLNNEVVNKYEIDIDNTIFKINIKSDIENKVYECEDNFKVFENVIYED